MLPGWPIYRSISKRPLQHRLSQEEPRTWPDEAKSAAALSASGEEDPRATLRKVWEKATALRRLWKRADNGTREWFLEAVRFDLNKGDDRKRPR
jgi:hypothetical protein